MILKALKYTRYPNEERAWSIIGKNDDYVYFSNSNLLVGKNASGKSRTLSVIKQIGSLFAENTTLKKIPSTSELFDLIFEDGDDVYKYYLYFKDKTVVTEKLNINGDDVLLRQQGEELFIKNIRTKLAVKDNELATISEKPDGTPLFAPILGWGKSIKNYSFTGQIDKKRLIKDYTIVEKDEEPGHPLLDSNMLLYTFHRGKELYGNKFLNEIKSDMEQIGYEISDVYIEKKAAGYGLCVKEDLCYVVSQAEMAQGMFRALSLFIVLSYARLNKQSLCLLIDDMGEGLDFDRSKRLIELVIKKINHSDIQFIMSTNDRNIMNQIPLRFWNVIKRERSKSIFFDYTNSQETFDDFRYTGLNNFDFLSTDFYEKGFDDADDIKD